MSKKTDDYSAEKSVVPAPVDQTDAADSQRVMRTVAALGVVLGTWGLISLPFGLMRFHQGGIPGDPGRDIYDMSMRGISIDLVWLFISSLSGAGLAFLLLCGSVGALSFRPWSRPVLLLWAAGSLGLSAVGSTFYLHWLLPPWRSHFAEVRGVVDSLVNFGGWGMGTLLAIVLLILLNSATVKSVFGPSDPPHTS